MKYCTRHSDGVLLHVIIAPRASRNAVLGEYQGRLKIALTAPPVDGEANAALIDFLAALLKVPKRALTIEKGETSKRKIVAIAGVTMDHLLSRLAA